MVNTLQDLLRKIQRFQEDVKQEVSMDSMDLHRLETLLEEFIAPSDIDIPEVALLKKVNALIEIYCWHMEIQVVPGNLEK